VLAAWLVYLNMGEVSKTRNNGELITPARPLEKLQLKTSAGKPFGFEELKGTWHLVYIGQGPCATACQERLSTMHQTRMAQGSSMSRVRLLYLALDKLPENADKLRKDYARLTILTGEQQNITKTIKLFETDATYNIREDHLIYMIDPLGNLMMRYKKDIRLIGIIKDLEHLLKYSQIG
jgi:cytochrome oxidase Cu insertion factor (SCO1/SenC/PrrC family)